VPDNDNAIESSGWAFPRFAAILKCKIFRQRLRYCRLNRLGAFARGISTRLPANVTQARARSLDGLVNAIGINGSAEVAVIRVTVTPDRGNPRINSGLPERPLTGNSRATRNGSSWPTIAGRD
jgi:hypothetical protein